MNKIYDCIIVGAGPSGLMAAIYLARYQRNFKIIDNNKSRALLIKKTHNFPTYSRGISGQQLLLKMRNQLKTYAVKINRDTVLKIIKNKIHQNFIIKTTKKDYSAKTVILATGVVDIEPVLPNLKNAIKKGLIRHCPICDAFEVKNQKIGVIGFGKKGLSMASFLRKYSDEITYLTLGEKLYLNPKEKIQFKKQNIHCVTEPIVGVLVKKHKIQAIKSVSGKSYQFDTLYSSLGTYVRTELAVKLGASHQKDKSLYVNSKQETNIPGLYAVGDIVAGLNQISVAMGQAAIAATHIHKHLP